MSPTTPPEGASATTTPTPLVVQLEPELAAELEQMRAAMSGTSYLTADQEEAIRVQLDEGHLQEAWQQACDGLEPDAGAMDPEHPLKQFVHKLYDVMQEVSGE